MPSVGHCRHCFGACPGDCLLPGDTGETGVCIHNPVPRRPWRERLRLMGSRRWWRRLFVGPEWLALGAAHRSLAGRPPRAPFLRRGAGVDVHERQGGSPSRGRMGRAEGRENMCVTQGEQVGAILGDPCKYLTGSADGPVAGDDDIDIGRRALEQSQPDEVVPYRVGVCSRRESESRHQKACRRR